MDLLSRVSAAGCPCGREHTAAVRAVAMGNGALASLPEHIRAMGASSVFVLSDRSIKSILETRVFPLLKENGIPFSSYVFDGGELKPDESAVGSALLHFDRNADLLLAVGSGVINDIGKILAATSGKPYIVVATAPSMDGYASTTSSVTRGGLKVSLATRVPDVIIGDTAILKGAPTKALLSGLGDMIAKYVSIAEWRMAHLITGEYYCEEIASLMRSAVKTCVDNAEALLRREDAAVEAVFEGLLLGGLCMSYAGVSRPASGVEHYLSHLLDMRSVAFGTPEERHGIQCAVGTYLAVGCYERLMTVTPDRDKALAFASRFDLAAHAEALRSLVGSGAEAMIAAEAVDGKYDPARHRERLDRILSRWKDILSLLAEELPKQAELRELYHRIGLPTALAAIGTDDALLPSLLRATADIRDKYVLSRLLWDLGIPTEAVC